MKALISPSENNRICQIDKTGFPVAEPLFWVPCPTTCTTEWTYVDGQFLQPEPPAPAPIPSVTAVQIRLELNKVGLRQQVEDVVANGSQDLKDKWQYATTFIHDDADIVAMAQSLGLSQNDLDQLFVDAASL